MTGRPKDIGTAAETAVVRFLRDNGFPLAERRALHGSTDRGDITGTPGLVWEVKGGDAAKTASMSSTKSSIGHLLGAAGAVEAIFSILAIRDQIVPPTLNLDNPSVETAIDLVPHKAKKKEINVALSNSFGFGGTNATLVMSKYQS